MQRRSDVARACDRKFKWIDVKSLLVSVRQKPDKVVLLEALGRILVIDEGAGSGRVPVEIQF